MIGVAGALILGQAALAGPAAAKVNCTFEGTVETCSGGSGEGVGGAGGGAGRHSISDGTGGFTTSGGGGFGGGPGFGQSGRGFGEHCDSDRVEQPCVGGGSLN
jgi:hypothetical protein